MNPARLIKTLLKEGMIVNRMKMGVLTAIGMVGSAVIAALGGWDSGLQTLLCFMAVDYITGVLVALVFKRSPKTKTGTASSQAGLIGLAKKGGMLLLVLVAVRLDVTLGTDYARDAVIIALIANELISLVENLGLMGVPIPKPITKAIELLKLKEDETNVH